MSLKLSKSALKKKLAVEKGDSLAVRRQKARKLRELECLVEESDGSSYEMRIRETERPGQFEVDASQGNGARYNTVINIDD